MSKFELGDRVVISGTVRKVYPGAGRTEYKKQDGAPWDYMGTKQSTRREYTEGVVVGKRTMQMGKTEGGGWDYPATFRCDGSIEVYLVAYHLRRKHVMCLEEQLTNKEEENEQECLTKAIEQMEEEASEVEALAYLDVGDIDTLVMDEFNAGRWDGLTEAVDLFHSILVDHGILPHPEVENSTSQEGITPVEEGE